MAYRNSKRMGELTAEAHHLAELWLVKGVFHQAESLYRRILFRLLDAPTMDGELILGVSSLLAELQVRWGQLQGGQDLYEKASELAARLGILASPTLSIVKNNLGLICKTTGDYDKSVRYYEEAVSGFSDLNARTACADVWDNLGALAYRKLELEEAVGFHENALGLRQQLEPDSPDRKFLSRTCWHLVAACRAVGRFRAAAEFQVLALEHEDRYGLLLPLWETPPPKETARLAVDPPATGRSGSRPRPRPLAEV